MPGIVSPKVKCGILLRHGGNVEGGPARQGHHDLVQLREVRKQGGRDEGGGNQEQQGVASVVLIVIRQGVSGENSMLNLVPLRPFGVASVFACDAYPVCVDVPHWRQRDAAAEAGEPERRWVETERWWEEPRCSS